MFNAGFGFGILFLSLALLFFSGHGVSLILRNRWEYKRYDKRKMLNASGIWMLLLAMPSFYFGVIYNKEGYFDEVYIYSCFAYLMITTLITFIYITLKCKLQLPKKNYRKKKRK